MKILCVSDLQSYEWNSYPETDERGINLRLLDTVKELKRLHDLSLKNGVKMLCVLGDIFEARSLISVSVLNAVYESLYAFHESGIKVVLLVGNHDRTSVGNDHALKVFKSFATVIDKPTTIPLDHGNLVGIPFHPRDERMRQALAKYVNTKTSLLIMHCAVKSTRLPSGKIWGQGISLDDIPVHVTALLGHFHRWTELRPGKVWYLGSLGPVDFGDASIDKFYAVYNTTNDSVSFHHSRFPQFVTLELSLKEGMQYDPGRTLTPSHLDIEKYLGVIPGNFLKIKRLPMGFTDFQGLSVVLTSLGARHVRPDLESLQGLVDISGGPAEDSGPEWSSMPVMEMLEQYVDTTPHNLNSQHLVETGKSIIEFVEGIKQKSEEESEVPLVVTEALEDEPLDTLVEETEPASETESLDEFLERLHMQRNEGQE